MSLGVYPKVVGYQDYFTYKVCSVGKSGIHVTSHREILYGPLMGFKMRCFSQYLQQQQQQQNILFEMNTMFNNSRDWCRSLSAYIGGTAPSGS